MEIKELKQYELIVDTLSKCSNDFYNQKLNNFDDILKLSSKFYKFGRVFAAYSEEQLAGFISFYMNDYESLCAYLSMIIIKEDFQHKGVGSELLELMIDNCVSNGFKYIKSEVANSNIKSICFFIKNGFNLVGKNGDYSSYYLKIIGSED